MLTKDRRQDMPIDMLKHPNVKVGLGDGGAHLGVFQEASCPTFMLTHYVRDRHGERIPLEEAVKLQTSDTAHLLGLKDRGVIAEGLRADINIIDHGEPGRLHCCRRRFSPGFAFTPATPCVAENLKLNPPFMADDLPTGASRWLQTADGFKMTLVAGQVTFENGVSTGSLPGRLVRSPLRPHLSVTRFEDIDPQAIAGPEPHSTADTMLEPEDLVGGASAVATAVRTTNNMRRAEGTTAFGDFLSGKMLRKEQSDAFSRVRQQEHELATQSAKL